MLEGQSPVTQCHLWLGRVCHGVVLTCLHEALGHAIALLAAYRGGRRLKANLSSKQASLFSSVRRAVVTELSRRCGGQLVAEAFSTLSSIKSRISSPLYPLGFATPPMASRALQSRAKVTLSLAPPSQRNSKPPAQQRISLVFTAIRLWAGVAHRVARSCVQAAGCDHT